MQKISRELIAPCGMNCALCIGYQRAKNPCEGCWTETPNKRKSCTNCSVRNCDIITANESKFCYECEKIPCRRLKQLDTRYTTKYGMSMLENLMEIKEKGIEQFLQNQQKKFECPNCGKLFSVHRDTCQSCGEVKKI